MTTSNYKKKISKGVKKKMPVISSKKELESKLEIGIKQLKNGEAIDMGVFLRRLKEKYSKF